MSKRKQQEPIHIKSVIHDVIHNYHYSKNSDLFQITDIWESTVGTTIANDARPWKINGHKLEVHVSASVWLQHLNYMKNDMIQKLNDRLGSKVIHNIQFKIGNF
jgi:predicted nucleic acid-binding Zn ribbon protein